MEPTPFFSQLLDMSSLIRPSVVLGAQSQIYRQTSKRLAGCLIKQILVTAWRLENFGNDTILLLFGVCVAGLHKEVCEFEQKCVTLLKSPLFLAAS